jgi:O-methyltransferase
VLDRIKKVTWNYLARHHFYARLEERLWREHFFYSAFQALSFNGICGDYVEFGSWGGNTFKIAYWEARRHGHGARLWAFDSFQGLPEQSKAQDEHPRWERGAMSTSEADFHAICASNGIPRDEYRAVPGFYDHTLPKLGATGAPNDIALAYIDCDLYSSTMSVLEFLLHRLKNGMIIGFDDYFCWSATQLSGERRAQLEFFSHHPRWELVPYIQFGWHGQSFVVEDREIMGVR